MAHAMERAADDFGSMDGEARRAVDVRFEAVGLIMERVRGVNMTV